MKGAVADFDLIEWQGRTVYIAFDANAKTNVSVSAARRCLAQELKERGALVRFVELPADFGGNGIDDFLYGCGPDAALALFEAADLHPIADPDVGARHIVSNVCGAINALLDVAGIDSGLHKGFHVLVDKMRGAAPGEWVEFKDGDAGALLPGDADVADSSKTKRWQRWCVAFENEQAQIGKRLMHRIPGRAVREGKADRLRFVSSKYRSPLVQCIAEIERRAKSLKGTRANRLKAAALEVYAKLAVYDAPEVKIKVKKEANTRPKKNHKRDRFLKAAREILTELLPHGEDVLDAAIADLHVEIETLGADLRGRAVGEKESAVKDGFHAKKLENTGQIRARVVDKSVQYGEPRTGPNFSRQILAQTGVHRWEV